MGDTTSGVADTMKLPRLIYWLSLLLLIVGGRVLIDPSHRQVGESIQVYITLAAFELYMWMLLLLAKWQWRKGLATDVVRSGLFAVGLQGLMFIALNELLMISPAAGVVMTILATILAGAKLWLAQRWLEFRLPGILLGLLTGWLLLLPASGVVFCYVPQDSPLQHTMAYVFCWITTALAAGHAVLAAWRKDAIRNSAQNNERWWIGWLISGSLGVLTVVQLYSLRRAFFVDFQASMFMPILAAGAMAGIVLTVARGWREAYVWAVLGIVFVVMLSNTRVFNVCSCGAEWMKTAGGVWVHPVYPGMLLASLLAIVTGAKLKSRSLFIFGCSVLAVGVFGRLLIAVGPLILKGIVKAAKGIGRGVQLIFAWRYAPGVFLLGGAFATLGIGAWLQHYAAKKPRKPHMPFPPPLPPTEEDTAVDENLSAETIEALEKLSDEEEPPAVE